MDGDLAAILAFAGYLAVALVLGVLFPYHFRWIVALGAVAAGAEWFLAYRDSAAGAGDAWTGADAVLLTGFFAVFFWLPLWIVAAIVGRTLTRRRKGSATDRSQNLEA